MIVRFYFGLIADAVWSVWVVWSMGCRAGQDVSSGVVDIGGHRTAFVPPPTNSPPLLLFLRICSLTLPGPHPGADSFDPTFS